MDPVPLFLNITIMRPGSADIVVLCVALFLLVCSGLISASEMAFFSLDPEALDTIKAGKHSADKQIEKLRSRSEHLLATILVCNNLVNIAIITLLDYFISRIVDFGGSKAIELLLVTILLTFLLLLFGEIIPKIYSAQHTLRFCRFIAPVLATLDKVFHPISSLLMRSQAITSRIISYRADKLTVSDLEHALELTDKEELKDESRMLEGILHFGAVTVKEIMTPRVDLVDIEIHQPFDEVLKCVTETKTSRIPVYTDTEDNIKGILYTKDLLPHIDKPASFRWQKLIRAPYFVPETKMIDDLLNDFQKLKVHIAIVVDEFGGTSGIVTMEDILEEIVGEIDDEYDEMKKPFARIDKVTYLFEGKCQLIDMTRILHLDDDFFGDAGGDADTLAGLLLELKSEFPELHEKITFRNLTFETMEMSERRIVKVKVTVGEQGE